MSNRFAIPLQDEQLPASIRRPRHKPAKRQPRNPDPDALEGALLAFLDATEWDDTQEVGGEPLSQARRQALEALESKAPHRPAPAAFVFVYGGCVSEILNENGDGFTHTIHVIDWDGCDGLCPVCSEELDDDSTCPKCGLNADTDDNDAALKAWRRVNPEG